MDAILNYLATHTFDVIGMVIGFIYLYLEFNAKKSMWIVSLVMAVLYIYIFMENKMYAMSLIYVYFFFASINGWREWHKVTRRKKVVPIMRMPHQYSAVIARLFLVASVAIFLLLKLLTDNNMEMIMGDTIATALSVVAIWMAAKRWAEQWCLLIPANLLTAVILYGQMEYASSLLFFVYFIASIFGFRRWIQLAQRNQPA
ncbi:hypothetical protein B9T10_06010 [Wohlfahrtiimonas chitiniclastica]|uniref:nicotinamide riboside transporter PnuC n=1 Tax=Wohlfahrtiimonas chitiniclastica TaxID=400946 RepID=UPI000B980775|nr:nicotinamide riboside transporter PnuC [Wohlfahrtiimonas chitiniclastica]OYQ74916.1 hypothetical protein B9T18_06680 [Wohlfahrtiimonas chitiniclastica]OYQ88845.1 hypothetical protein B9T10_06010 [Wohlfahrtiimonas chitiniclastica]